MWKNLGIVIFVAVVSLVIFWVPFLVHIPSFWGINFGMAGMDTIVRNFDGLNYLTVAKTLYLGTETYYAAHFPLYPLIIRAFMCILNGPMAMLAATIFSNIILGGGLYLFFRTILKNEKLALAAAIAALFFPARMLSVRAVGSSEPLFIGLTALSLAFAFRNKPWPAAVLGALAVLTRSLGILLFGAYILAWMVNRERKIAALLPYLLLPLALAGLFWYYREVYGSFFAYFQSSSELHPVFFPPLLIFSNTQKWITGMWREEFIYLFLFYGAGLVLAIKKLNATAWFGILYGTFLLFVAHQDLARYALPLAPIAITGYAPRLGTKYAKWLLILLVPIYLLGWQFVLRNVQPIADWKLYL